MAKSRLVSSALQIQQSTGFTESFKSLLDSLEEQDVRPAALTQWTRRVFSEGQKEGYSEKEIVNCVIVYANERHYAKTQIYAVLSDNGVRSYDRYSGGKIPDTGIYQNLVTYKRFILGTTGLRETQIMQADYSPHKIQKAAHGNLVDWISHMGEAELREFPRWLGMVNAVIEDALDILEQKKNARSKYGK